MDVQIISCLGEIWALLTVMAFQILIIQSIHAGSGWFALIYQGAMMLCKSIICAQCFPLDEGGACHSLVCASDLFLPEVLLKQWKVDCEGCQLFCGCIKTLTRVSHAANKHNFLVSVPFWSLFEVLLFSGKWLLGPLSSKVKRKLMCSNSNESCASQHFSGKG